MKRLAVRCFGGFEVWHGDGQLTGFESQKTKALLAYLLSHRGRVFTRDRVAALLWPETSEETARRNLRQAVYSLKKALPGQDRGRSPIVSSAGELRFNPSFDCWYDVEAFERELSRGTAGGPPDLRCLATAVGFYRGDFLAGFLVKDSEAFELWMMTEQERLRDKVAEALRHLVESYMARGEYRFGVQHARRLVAIDPLAEEAYRYLMQLYALSGRRNQALAQYEELRKLLATTMEVEPLPETEALYQAILEEEKPSSSAADGEPTRPLIPLVGRRDATRRLERGLQSVLGGRGHLTLVAGEAGVGKSSLIRSLLHAAGAEHDFMVLQGRCFAEGPALYKPFPLMLKTALAAETPDAARAVTAAPAEVLAELRPLVPALHSLRPDLPPPTASPATTGRERLFDATARILALLSRTSAAGAHPGALVVFLDDLHLAGAETFDLLAHLRERLAATATWIVAAYRSDALAEEHPLRRLEQLVEARDDVSQVLLERLEPAAVEELAASLVGGDQAAAMTRFLLRWGEGLPLAMVEAVNFLLDEGVLVPEKGGGGWLLTDSPEGVAELAGESFTDLIVRRFRSLPKSTRQLAAMATVIGQTFDTELLQQAGDELLAVVEIGLELMIERWLIRQFADSWMASRRQRDIVLWAKGARRGSFEFAHELTWRAICESIDPERRRIMHGEVAAAIEKPYREAAAEPTAAPGWCDAEGLCETLAYHFAAAGHWDRAFHYLAQSARRARGLQATEAASDYDARCLEVLETLIATAADAQQAERWEQERAEILRRRDELGA